MTEVLPQKKIRPLHSKKKTPPKDNNQLDETRHLQAKIDDSLGSKQHDRSYLINKLNFINFQDEVILINFKHKKYDRSTTLRAKPKHCLGDTLDCVWVETDGIQEKLRSYEFSNFFILDGIKLLSVIPEVHHIYNNGIRFRLPEICYEISTRKVNRHDCHGVAVQLVQNSSIFQGRLIDFNATSFCVELRSKSPKTFQTLNQHLLATVYFLKQAEYLYAGECRITRNTMGNKTRQYVLKPVKSHIQRFESKDHRSVRQVFAPSPDIVFRHPFTQKKINLKVIDIAGSGFSVEENRDNPLLLPGMILPELEIRFTRNFSIHCKAQVVYKKEHKDSAGHPGFKCGIAFLDMDMSQHVQLMALLQRTEDGNTRICNEVDMDALWEFFFETGFIYANKYEFIRKNKAKIKKTYQKLYTESPSIARHFIYQDKGNILGHMAMLRFYENTWLIHHHAAKSSASKRAGIKVLQQIGQFGNDSHRLYSSHMDYFICYYRPDNKFPNRVFGGATRFINDRNISSLDDFSYFHLKDFLSENRKLQKPWKLLETTPDDLSELNDYYQHISGGLMVDALNLTPNTMNIKNLSKEYRKHGFERKRLIFSLKRGSTLHAILMVNIADMGLNLSDLTRCIKVLVLRPMDLSAGILQDTLSHLTKIIKRKDLSVLLFPLNFTEKQMISYEKIYTLWIMNLQYTDSYFRFIDRLLRVAL